MDHNARMAKTMAALTALLSLAILPLSIAQSTDPASDCVGDQYMSNNGLNFYTDCLDAGNSHTNLTSFNYFDAVDLNDCMNNCALSRPRCYAVVFSDGTCYEYDENLFPRNVDGTTAVANASQLATPDDEALECPYDPYSTQTVDGQEYQIVCDADFGGDGGDYCPWEGYPSRCFRHADSLEECLQYCSEAHPLCKGVTYNPDMISGYGNCYLKEHPEGSYTPNGYAAHSAMVTERFYEDLDTACPTTSPYAMGGSNYSVECKAGRVGTQNITSVHSNTLDSCLGECSSSVEDECLGVLFDMGMLDGFRNCYLLNNTGSPLTGGANMTFAELASSEPGSPDQPDDDDDDGDSGSKAWIAGPVIGAIVAIALVILGVLWWRRRQAREWPAPEREPEVQHVARMEKEQPPEGYYSTRSPENAAEPAEKPADTIVRHELNDPNSERLFPPEMKA